MDEYFTKTAALLLRFRAEIYDARPRPSLEQVVKIAYKATKVVQGHAEKMAVNAALVAAAAGLPEVRSPWRYFD